MPTPDSRLPSLTMLRAFEAVGRHESMSSAAKELSVTHGAVSRQVAALEAFLRTPLVRRRSRGIELTESGKRLFHGIGAGFDRIRSTVENFARERRDRYSVGIATLPSFAERWLVSNLADFQASHPDFDIHIHSSVDLCDLRNPEIDFAIRYGRGVWPNAEAQPLMTVNAFPICSPSLIDRHGTPERPEDLLRMPLLHDVTKEWWIDWFAAAGVRVSSLPSGITVDEYGLALQLARAGHGVVLARDPITRHDVGAGEFVRLFDVSFTPHFAYYLVRSSNRPLSTHAKILFEWLRQRRQLNHGPSC